MAAVLSGCLSERSFQLNPAHARRLDAESFAAAPPSCDTRAWLQRTHETLSDLLPADDPAALLTEDLSRADGTSADVFAHFNLRREHLQSLLANGEGIRHTAQAAARDYYIDRPAPAWPGFDDVWIPVRAHLSLAARVGWAMDGDERRTADAIVIMPGLFGDNGVQRTRDLAIYLRETGFHVLALEIRGHGQTEHGFPDQCHTFGVLETDELMLVSDWLTQDPYVKRTGLVGFCWSANIALLAPWYDARLDGDSSISPALSEVLLAGPTEGRFTAGVMAFSPIPRWEEMLDKLDTPRSIFTEPIYAAIQDTVRDRMARKGYTEPSGNLRRLIDYDYQACDVQLPGGVVEGYSFLRLLPYAEAPSGDKLERARVPVLIVHGCNDPLSPAQDVADLLGAVHNPRVAALILPGGGHVGFAAYAKRYYYSLVAGFFDSEAGAAGLASPDGSVE